MSLWTPDGEHPVDRGDDSPGAESSPQHDGLQDQYDIDPDAEAKMQDQLAMAQAQLLAAPVDQVVSNHVMGLFELAALHLRVDEPDLDAARLPIDAMGLLVDNLGDRLADSDTLTAALTQLRMAFVEVKKHMEPGPAAEEGESVEAGPDDDAEPDDDADSSATEDDISESDFLE